MNMKQEFVIQEALEEHDKNGDGFVSLEEFLGDYRRDPSKQLRGKWEEGGKVESKEKEIKTVLLFEGSCLTEENGARTVLDFCLYCLVKYTSELKGLST